MLGGVVLLTRGVGHSITLPWLDTPQALGENRFMFQTQLGER